MWFWTLCSLNWLLMMMMIYVDEFLHEIREDFYGVCMYWKMLMLIVDDLLCERMYCRVICSCIHKLDIYIHIGDDSNTLYSYWQWKWYICILRWRPWWLPVPHVFGEYLHWWTVYLLNGILSEIWWICEDVKMYLRVIILVLMYLCTFMTCWDFIHSVCWSEILYLVM